MAAKPKPKSAEEWLAESERILKEIREMNGTDADDEPLTFEENVVEIVKETRRIGNLSLNVVTPGVHSLNDNYYELVGSNGRYAVLMEIHQTLRINDVIFLAEECMPALRRDFLHEIKGKIYKGALIYRRLGGNKEAVAREALDRGLMLVRVVGRNKQLHHIKTMAEALKPARQLVK